MNAPRAAGKFQKTLAIGTYPYVDSKASAIDPKQEGVEYDKASQAYGDLSRAAATGGRCLSGQRRAGRLRFAIYSLLDAAAKADAWDGKMENFSGVYGTELAPQRGGYRVPEGASKRAGHGGAGYRTSRNGSSCLLGGYASFSTRKSRGSGARKTKTTTSTGPAWLLQRRPLRITTMTQANGPFIPIALGLPTFSRTEV